MTLERMINSTAVTKVSTLKQAKRWAGYENNSRPARVFMGDNNKYWVVSSLKLSKKLIEAGYERVSPLEVLSA